MRKTYSNSVVRVNVSFQKPNCMYWKKFENEMNALKQMFGMREFYYISYKYY